MLIFIQFSISVAIVVVSMYLFKKHVHKIIKIWMACQMKFLGITLEQVGQMDESCDMVILNHQSLLDIIVIEHIHGRHLAWVGKKEITDLPFFWTYNESTGYDYH
jgi:1-acyl-sn-glycerol-3-phosphate acyltransferase